MLGLSVPATKLFLGTCKLAAGIALFTDPLFHLQRLATFMAAVMYAFVAWAHYLMPDYQEIPPALILSALCLVSLFTTPTKPPAAVGSSKRHD